MSDSQRSPATNGSLGEHQFRFETIHFGDRSTSTALRLVSGDPVSLWVKSENNAAGVGLRTPSIVKTGIPLTCG